MMTSTAASQTPLPEVRGLGFFGFPTLGYHIAASFENLYFGEVWTYLYVLVALVLAVDWWSGQVRRRLVA